MPDTPQLLDPDLEMDPLTAHILELHLLDLQRQKQQQGSGAERLDGPYVYVPAHALDAPAFAREALGWDPDPEQEEILNNIHHKRVILNWGRQCGKSTVMAARILHWAATHPGKLILVIGGVESHTAELFCQIDIFLAAMGWPSRGQTGKRISRRLPNNSRIVATSTGKSSRSHTASLIVMDEAAYIPDSVWEGVFPTLAVSGGSLMAASTPQGQTGLFYEIWHNAKQQHQQWKRSQYKATQNPRVQPEVLEEARRLKGDSYVRQEFLCEFANNAKNLLPRTLVEKLYQRSE